MVVSSTSDQIQSIDDQRSNGRNGIDSEYLVELRDVIKAYESPAGRFLALKGIDLLINNGEFIAVVGKSGSGKSTLMNMITGIDRPTSGEVYVDNVGIHELSEGKIAVWRGRTLGIVFQFFQLLPTLTVIENVMLPMDFCHMYSLKERNERAMHLLDQVELSDQANKLPSARSGGQQQRVAIARALANDPPIIIADEPTGNLDTKTAASIFTLFEQLVDEGKTILMVTHDQDLAHKVSRTIYLVDGRIVNKDEFTQERVDIGQDEANQGAALEIQSESPNKEELETIRLDVDNILDSPSDAGERLKTDIFQSIATDDGMAEEVYQLVFDEVSFRARQAEEAGNQKEAQILWKALLEATE